MRKIFRFSFKRESYWLVVLYVVLPLLAILLLIVIPGLLRLVSVIEHCGTSRSLSFIFGATV